MRKGEICKQTSEEVVDGVGKPRAWGNGTEETQQENKTS